MEKYVRYERFHGLLNADEINKKFKNLVEDGWEIIHYSEKYVGRQNSQRSSIEKYNDPINEQKFEVTIICGKLNKGNKQIL